MWQFLILSGVFASSLVITGWWFISQIKDDSKGIAGQVESIASGLLADVTNGEDVLGINTRGLAEGVAVASYAVGTYSLDVVFDNLPDPLGTDFYEGWVVRRGEEPSVISTGRLVREGDTYKNDFLSSRNFMDHTFYILTLEPDDGDPAPAYHIAEGELQ